MAEKSGEACAKSTLVCLLVGAACSTQPPFEVFGSLHDTMMGGAAPTVDLGRVSPRDAIGVGALSELRGEVTLLDGRFWLAYAEGDGVRVLDLPSSDERAALLVVGRPKEWREETVPEDVRPEDLGNYLVEAARRLAWDVTKATSLRIEGSLTDVQWHVIDGSKPPAGANGHEAHMQSARQERSARIDATLVGFVSTAHAGVITHAGEVSHLHLVAPRARLTGHVDAVGLAKGARVRLGQ